MALERINSNLDLKKNELTKFEDELLQIKKELSIRSFEIEKKKKTLANFSAHSEGKNKSKLNNRKEKKFVQTSFFKPTIVKETVNEEYYKELI